MATSIEPDREARMEALLDAAREVERWYYERDALWVELTVDERQQADAALIVLHDALVAVGESQVVEDETGG